MKHALLTAAALTGLSLLALAAPAPRAKPVPPIDLVGTWDLTWAGGTGPALFRRDGTLENLWGGARYGGVWELKGADLAVRWWRADDPPDPGRERTLTPWTSSLARGKGGVIDGTGPHGSPWRFERRK